MLCMTLALVMMFSLVPMASAEAGTVEWVDSSGVTHVMTFTYNENGSVKYYLVNVPGVDETAHTGESSTLLKYVGTSTVSQGVVSDVPVTYKLALNQAVNKTDLVSSSSQLVTSNGGTLTVTVPASAAPGTYTIAVSFEGYAGAWKDLENAILSSYTTNGTQVEINANSGTVSFAPNNVREIRYRKLSNASINTQ